MMMLLNQQQMHLLICLEIKFESGFKFDFSTLVNVFANLHQDF